MEKASRRVALAFAYEGTRFDSFARQPGRRTVEGELIASLQRAHILRDAGAARFESASRTDRGVSAWWNVCAFDTRVDARFVAHAPRPPSGLTLLAAATVPDEFSPRRAALKRTYVYHLGHGEEVDWARARAAARLFVGRHDFRNFCRPDAGVDPVRVVSSIRVVASGESRALRIEAPSFLWEQVRRIVHAVVAAGRGQRSLASLRSQLTASQRRPEPAAAPEPLVLERVHMDVPFGRISHAAKRRWELDRRLAWSAWRFYDGFPDRAPTRRR